MAKKESYQPPRTVFKNFLKNVLSLFPACTTGIPSDPSRGVVKYIGNSHKKADYWIDYLCGPDTVRQTTSYRGLKRHLDFLQKNFKAEFIIFEESAMNAKYLEKIGGLRVPEWVEMVTLLSERFLSNKKYRRSLSFANEQSITLKVSNRVEDFNLFFEQLYLPFTKARHDKKAFFYDRKSFLSDLYRSEICLIYMNNSVVSGQFIIYESNKKVYLRALGMNMSTHSHQSPRLGDVTYALIFQHLQQRGCREVLFGGVHPFLNDNLTFYKMQWDSIPLSHPHPSTGHFRFLLGNLTPSGKVFLEENPIWFTDKLNEVHLAIMNSSGTIDQECRNHYLKKGIQNVKPFKFDEFKICFK